MAGRVQTYGLSAGASSEVDVSYSVADKGFPSDSSLPSGPCSPETATGQNAEVPWEQREEAADVSSLAYPACWNCWNVVVVIAAALTAYFGPFVASGLLSLDLPWVVCLQLLLDACFTVDLLLRCMGTSMAKQSTDPGMRSFRITIPSRGSNYFGGSFWIDVCGGPLPPLLQLLVPRKGGFMWLLLLLRLLRMLKLAHFELLALRWHQVYGLPLALTEFIKCLFVTSLAAHWVACTWLLGREEKNPWFGGGSQDNPCSGDDATSEGFCLYSLGLHWSTTTLTGAGYSDIVPETLVEYRVCTLCMYLMAYVWVFNACKVFALLLPSNTLTLTADALQTSVKQSQVESQMARLLQKNAELDASLNALLQAMDAGK